MAKLWKEALDVERHRDFMSGGQDAGGVAIDPARSDGWVYFVRECGFTFEFASVDQIRAALLYFSQTVHPPNLLPGINLEHFWQRWFERLPPGLAGGSKRERVLNALKRALDEFAGGTAGRAS